MPLVRELPPPPQLLQIDPHRVIGLTINPTRLLAYRHARLQHLPLVGSAYDDPAASGEEMARQLFRRYGWTTIDPVADRAGGEQAGERFLDRFEQFALAMNVQKALLLPGKAGIRQIFGSHRRAHRDIQCESSR